MVRKLLESMRIEGKAQTMEIAVARFNSRSKHASEASQPNTVTIFVDASLNLQVALTRVIRSIKAIWAIRVTRFNSSHTYTHIHMFDCLISISCTFSL